MDKVEQFLLKGDDEVEKMLLADRYKLHKLKVQNYHGYWFKFLGVL